MLNLPGHHATAAIVAEISYEGRDWINAFVAISDCDRKISLDFNPNSTDEGDYENDLHKVDTMIDCLKAFRRGLVQIHKGKPGR